MNPTKLDTNNSISLLLKKVLGLAPEVMWIFIGQAGTAIAGLIGIKLLTHILETSEFGRLALANTIATCVAVSFFGSFGQGFMRFWAICKDRENLHVFYTATNYFVKYASLILMLVIIACALFFFLTKDLSWTFLVTISLIIGVVTGLLNLRVSIFTAIRQRPVVACLNIGNAFLKPVIAAVLIIVLVAKASVALSGYILATGLVFLVGERLFKIKTKEGNIGAVKEPYLSRSLLKEVTFYSLPFLIWGVFSWIHTSCDRWALQAYHGTEVVGAFSVVSQLAIFPVIFIAGFLTTFFVPVAFQRAGDLKNKSSITSALKILWFMVGGYVLMVLVLLAIFALWHRPLILFISNEKFVTFSSLLPWLTFAWAFFYLGQVLVQFGLLMNRPKIYIAPKLAASMIAGASTFYLSFKVGPKGVVMGLLLAGITYALWCAALAVKINLLNSVQKCDDATE